MQIWRTVNLAAIGAWIGAMLLFGAVVAPVAFKVLPNRELAGAVGRLGRAAQRGAVAHEQHALAARCDVRIRHTDVDRHRPASPNGPDVILPPP